MKTSNSTTTDRVLSILSTVLGILAHTLLAAVMLGILSLAVYGAFFLSR